MEQMSLFDDRQGRAPRAKRINDLLFGRLRGPGAPSWEGKDVKTADRARPDIFHDILGAARRRKDDACQYHSRTHEGGFYQFQRSHQRNQGDQGGHEAGGCMGIRTVLFVDEIHRFNKAQQDAFLPFVEKGSIVLIGATTENPSFEVNAALLSRCRVFVLKALEEMDLVKLLTNALNSPAGLKDQNVRITQQQLKAIAAFANGDARTALNILEMAVINGEITADGMTVTNEGLEQCISKKSLLYDKNGEEHYNLISALHKSMRNSDPDAAIYWMCRMLEGGENPLYIARRLIRFASEDIGMADSHALQVAVAAYQACHFLGCAPDPCSHLSVRGS